MHAESLTPPGSLCDTSVDSSGASVVLCLAQRNARNLPREMSIDDPHCELRKACAHLSLSVDVLRTARKQAAKGDSEPLEDVLASLEARGVGSGIARRICGQCRLDSDVLKRRRDAGGDDGPGSSKAARSTPGTEPDSEDDAGPEGTGRRPLPSARARVCMTVPTHVLTHTYYYHTTIYRRTRLQMYIVTARCVHRSTAARPRAAQSPRRPSRSSARC